MTTVLYPALAIGAIGLFLGILLAVASKIFKVDVDERIPKITDSLPGANCGGCGYAGCANYASAIVKDNEKIGLCSAGGQKCAEEIAKIMGVEAPTVEEKKAFVRCGGIDDAASKSFFYDGIDTCSAATRLAGGPKNCTYGCLGYGTCMSVCNSNAISIKNGVAIIDENKCSACGACVKACPRGIIELVPKNAKYIVRCVSCDSGKDMKNTCSAGCIGCKICEKNCESNAITVDGNHAKIDYEKCTSCGTCMEKCPRKIIVKA